MKVQAAYNLIMKDSSLAQGDFERTSGGLANQQKILSAGFKDLQAKVGTALLPVMQKVVTVINQDVIPFMSKAGASVKSFIDGLKGNEDVGNFLTRVGEVTAQVVAVVQREWPNIQRIISDVLTTTQEVIRGFVDVVVTIWNQFGPQITAAVVATWNSMKGIIEGALQVIRGVIQTITALIHGDWSGVWNGIRNIAAGILNGLVALIGGIIGRARAALSALGEILAGIFKGAWDRAKTAVANGIEGVLSFFRQLPGRILAFQGAMLSAGLSIGAAIIRGIGRGLSNAVGIAGDIGGAVARAAKNAVNSIISRINSALEFTIPGPGPLPDIHINPPDIPRLHGGGVIGGTPGSEALRILQAGERVFTAEQAHALGRILAGAVQPSPALVITGNTFIGSGPEVVKMLNAKIGEARYAGVRLVS
jgi:hypothetical protein